MYCVNCGKEILDDAEKCPYCGTEVEDDDDDIVVLTDENGEEVEFSFLDIIQYNSKYYIILLPREEGAEEVVILEIKNAGTGNEDYVSVDSEATLNTVYNMFMEKNRDLFDFE